MLTLPNPREDLYYKYDINENGKEVTTHDPARYEYDYARIGPNALEHRVEFCKDHPSNWKRGIQKRVAHEYSYDKKTVRKFMRFLRTWIPKHIEPLEAGLDLEELLEAWLAASKYNNARKRKLRQLFHDFFANKINPEYIYANKSFIKKEFYAELKEPRIINSRSDCFKAIVGGLFFAAEHLIMKPDHYIKHKTPEQVAKEMDDMNKKHNYVYETDYSSFEGSFHPELQEACEKQLWRHVFRNYPKMLKIILKAYNTNVCIYKNKMKAYFKGSRMSGDMWTSMANGFTNQAIIEFMIEDAYQRHGYFDIDYLVEGDDGFICTDAPLDFNIPKLLGFKLKCEQKTDKNDVSFCGICEFEGKLVPDIRRILNHYGYVHGRSLVSAVNSKSKRSKKKLLDMIHSKALSLLAQSRGIPILQPIAQQQLKLGGHYNPKYVDWWEKEFYDFNNLEKMHAEPITDDMRLFVEKRFNIPVSTQLDIEKSLKDCKYMCYDIDIDNAGSRPASKIDVYNTSQSYYLF